MNVFDQSKFDQRLEAVLISDKSGRIVQINATACKLLGYSKQELLNQRLDIIIPERFRTEHWSNLDDWFREPYVRPKFLSLEVPCLRKSGKEIAVKIGLSPVLLKNKLAVEAVIIKLE